MPVEGQITVGELIEKLEWYSRYNSNTPVYVEDHQGSLQFLDGPFIGFFHFEHRPALGSTTVLVLRAATMSRDDRRTICEEYRTQREGGEG